MNTDKLIAWFGQFKEWQESLKKGYENSLYTPISFCGNRRMSVIVKNDIMTLLIDGVNQGYAEHTPINRQIVTRLFDEACKPVKTELTNFDVLRKKILIPVESRREAENVDELAEKIWSMHGYLKSCYYCAYKKDESCMNAKKCIEGIKSYLLQKGRNTAQARPLG